MIILMKKGSGQKEIDAIVAVLRERGLGANLSTGAQATVIGVLGDKTKLGGINLELMDGVEKCVPIMHSYKLASREMTPEGRTVDVGGVVIGGKKLVMMAGPCAVESEEQVMQAALGVKAAGAQFLRGGAYKPRTSPYAFQGLENEGYRILRRVGDETGLKVVSEIVSHDEIEVACRYCDMLQIGARNMQNFRLLREVGRSGKPVLLKRGIASTIEEWLDAAEYIMSEGNPADSHRPLPRGGQIHLCRAAGAGRCGGRRGRPDCGSTPRAEGRDERCGPAAHHPRLRRSDAARARRRGVCGT